MNRWLFASGASAGAAVLLAGCMSAPVPASTSAPWQPPKAAQTAPVTWQATRAEQPDFSRPLTLAELADIALRHNPANRKAWNDARAAAAQVQQARGYFLPTVSAVGAVQRARTESSPDTLNSDYLMYGPGLQLNYLILNTGGGRSAAVEQALQTVYAANFTFNRTLQTVLAGVQNAYYGLVSAQASVEAAQANVRDARKVLEAAQLRQQQDTGTALETLQAQAALDQALFGLAGAEGLVQTAKTALTQTLGAPADTALQVVPPPRDPPTAPASADLSRQIDKALQHRPDIAALRARLAASEAAITVAGAAQWPNLYATGRVARDYYNRWSGQFQPDNDWAFSGGLSLQWTLFDGLQTRSAKRIARAQAESARSQLQQAELAASAEVWNGYQNYTTALKKYQAGVAVLNSAQAAHALALDSYQAGLQSLLDLLTAESQLAQARSQQVAARQEVFTALVNLAYATGRMEQGAAEDPRPAAPRHATP